MTRTALLTAVALGVMTLSVSAIEAGSEQKSAGNFKVRGQWTITVTNADGSVASTQELENEYLPSPLFGRLLVDRRAIQYWFVTFLTAYADGSYREFVVDSVGGPPTSVESHHNLIVDAPSTGPDAGRLVLSGTFRGNSPAEGRIRTVRAALTYCPLTGPCEPTSIGGGNYLSSLELDPGESFGPGQSVQFRVVYSFF